MPKTILKNGTVLLENKLIKTDIEFCNGKITSLVSTNQCEKIIDCTNNYIFPGFINLHVHGGGGGDSCRLTNKSYELIKQSNLESGTTSIVLAVAGMENSFIHQCIQFIKSVDNNISGAHIIGLHLEGPWLNHKRKAAVPSKGLISIPKLLQAEDLISGSEELIKIITLSPELDGIESIIEYLCKKNIIVALGHSDATFSQAEKAISLGASHFTHTYNAMSTPTGREPALVGAASYFDNSYTEIIADGFHVHYANIVNLIKTKPLDKIILVTDGIEAAGSNITSFDFPEIGTIKIHDGRTWGPNDILVGSVLTLDKAIKNILDWTSLDIPDVINMVTCNPAKELRLYPDKGTLNVGADADIVVMNKDFTVIQTYIDGELEYLR